MKYNSIKYEDDGSLQKNKEIENPNSILVYLRIRPFLPDELSKDNTTLIKGIDLNNNILKSKKNKNIIIILIII